MMAKAAPRANHDRLTVNKSLSPRKRLPTSYLNGKNSSAKPAGQEGPGLHLQVQPKSDDLQSCFIRTKAHKLKKRFAYVVDNQLHMTYLDHEKQTLVVVLSMDLSKSHAILEEPRTIDFFTEVSAT